MYSSLPPTCLGASVLALAPHSLRTAPCRLWARLDHAPIQFNSLSHGTMTLTQQARPQASRAAIGGHSRLPPKHVCWFYRDKYRVGDRGAEPHPFATTRLKEPDAPRT